MTIMIMAAVFFAFERSAENTRSQPDHIVYNVGTLWKHETYMYAQCNASVALWTATEMADFKSYKQPDLINFKKDRLK